MSRYRYHVGACRCVECTRAFNRHPDPINLPLLWRVLAIAGFLAGSLAFWWFYP